MKKTAVLLYPQFSEYELTVALSILMQGKKPVVTVGLNDRAVRGEAGLQCIPDTTIAEVDQAEIDSLLLTGCMDILALQNEADLIKFIRRTGSKASVIASISSSPFLLAKAGLLQGKKYTVGMTEENRKKTGVFEPENYSEEPVVRDGNLITARGRGFIQFGTLLGQALNLSFDGDWYKGRA
ncbi:Putative intracellular protease/amidase [Paenibacillus sophorae]|uniref:DJ-1/PfpI family protein n=1 Tax=Paenibacillus sophorae TaxID=1333845 RepID=A0A1H8IQ89_9BACL|nr:DJ-1/PfpI family protein [Paenibacillus sophorae]QWU16026.1 DJ-1/PfpI family protein [Paenibacillus sophorae]SEN70255.1 Putative intracellular protease/amidase [Paenibacillus sophorae]